MSGGHDSLIARINMEGEPRRAWTVDGMSSASAIGPYGVHLNWDDTQLWVVSKGEATHNRGISLGLVNPTIMRAPPYTSWAPGPVGEIHTGCLRGDHGTVHPNPDLDQLWVTCNGSFEIVVFDMFNQRGRRPNPDAERRLDPLRLLRRVHDGRRWAASTVRCCPIRTASTVPRIAGQARDRGARVGLLVRVGGADRLPPLVPAQREDN